MPSSPRTPTRRRKSSTRSSQGIDVSFTSQSPQYNHFGAGRSSHSRKSSQYSAPSPSTPRPGTSHSRNEDFGSFGGFGGVLDSRDGLGSLADELAEAYSDEEEGEPEECLSGDHVGELEDSSIGHQEERDTRSDHGGALHNGLSTSSIPGFTPDTARTPTLWTSPKQRRRQSHYNRLIDCENPDLEEAEGIRASLEARMAAIEGFARQGTATDDTETDAVMKRVVESLKDLGSQSGVEGGTARLITAHNALTTHLSFQTRLLQTLSQSLFSPLSLPPDISLVEPLLLDIATLLLQLPIPAPKPLTSLHTLQSTTTDLLITLSLLSDTLHMARQTTSLASRRLRASREMVEELRREESLKEEGVRWVERGSWEERLRGRECARMCGEVVGGFEEVCRGWRERLVGEGGMTGVEVGAG